MRHNPSGINQRDIYIYIYNDRKYDVSSHNDEKRGIIRRAVREGIILQYLLMKSPDRMMINRKNLFPSTQQRERFLGQGE